MQKRIVTIGLFLLLIVTVLACSAYADLTYSEVRSDLLALAEHGSPEGEDTLCYTACVYDEAGSLSYRIRVREEVLRICSEDESCSVALILPEQQEQTLSVLVREGENEGTAAVCPADYREDTKLTFSAYEGEPEAQTRLEEVLNARLADLVEVTGLVLDSPEAPDALGFTAFSRHQYHAFDKGTVTTAPTCTAQGVKTFTCRICGETRTVTIPALGHAWRVSKVKVSTAETMHGTADYTCTRCGAGKSGALCASEVFSDAPAENHWAHKGVDWAFLRGITDGVSDTGFAPGQPCTRAQVVTFLYRAAGSPAVSGTCPFTDVKPSDYFCKPVLWAVQNGITDGVSDTGFAPNQPCTRAQVVTFLYRAAGSPAISGASPFADVKPSDYFCKPVLWAVKNGITDGVSASSFAPGTTCTRAHVVTFLCRDSKIRHANTAWDQTFSLWYGDTKLSSRACCQGNRTYVNRSELEERFGKTLPAAQLTWPTIREKGVDYVALADAAAFFGLEVRYCEEDYSVRLYKLGQMPWTVLSAQSGQKTAYIRLEDIVADYGLNGRFDHASLTRHRLFCRYLRDHSDGFYIAWIPLYVSGPKNLQNDISTEYNFYNADFVYTLDTMILNGGKIGLHGLTHQDEDNPDSVSGSGYEFGPRHELTEEQIVARFDRAKQIASAMGYSWSFFEFPHYSTTAFQRSVADKHFDVVYQQDPDVPYSKQGQIVTHTVGSHKCRWVPTPADYVNGRSDLPNILNRLQTSYDKKKIISLFFHPYVDSNFITVHLNGDTMTCDYDQQTNVIPNVVTLITELGYRFGYF